MANRKAQSKKTDLLAKVVGFGVILGLVAIWEAAFQFKWLNLALFPPPSQFLSYLKESEFSIGFGPERMEMHTAVLASFVRIAAGLSLAFAFALIVATAISGSRYTRYALTPLLQFLAPMAPIAWIPVGIVLFGLSNATAIFIVFMGTAFSLTLAAITAVQGVNSELLRTGAILGATGLKKWRYVVLPAVMPEVFLMMRLNFFGAWMAVLAAEMVGSRDGLGAVILIGRESSNPNLILIGMSLIAVSGFAIDRILLFIQRRILWWNPALSSQAP
jgi:NitT/TauT family transport system permease protein